jgi:pyruvate/2-oxoglutarate/acetoin dehydrogenase E1 component
MPRLVGLAHASRLYRELADLHHLTHFSRRGDEVAFATIGNASCAEGMFWESLNALGILQVPAVVVIWDDGYGISVPQEFQSIRQSLSDQLQGFRRTETERGFDLYTVRGWEYAALLETFAGAAETARRDHVPAIVHVTELTQPQGHSTSGSHERYKSADRLRWEQAHDALPLFRRLLLDEEVIGEQELAALEKEALNQVHAAREAAWKGCHDPIRQESAELTTLLETVAAQSTHAAALRQSARALTTARIPQRHTALQTAHAALRLTRHEALPARADLRRWYDDRSARWQRLYSSHLHSEGADSTLRVTAERPDVSADSPLVSGFQVLNATFDAILARDPRVLFFGEDVGKLGGVNQALAGLQAKYGPLRVADTGIREATIIGQATGLAMRGLRPIAEIQYLDYMLYAVQLLSDDVASLRWRSAGGQKAPLIVRTRGHRLEGIWHSGSPMGGLIHLLRGIWLVVPRDMTRAAAFYNTLLAADEPGIIVEVLNGYRLKEPMPANVGTMRLPLGVPEILRPGDDVTVVTYGASCRVALESAEMLAQVGIEIEVIDVQTLLPFDRPRTILQSLQKTGRIVFLDEDVPGGATAFMAQQVIEAHGGFDWLDAAPVTLTARAHRPAYGSDGNHFSKPNAEALFDVVHRLMNEVNPTRYPEF